VGGRCADANVSALLCDDPGQPRDRIQRQLKPTRIQRQIAASSDDDASASVCSCTHVSLALSPFRRLLPNVQWRTASLQYTGAVGLIGRPGHLDELEGSATTGLQAMYKARKIDETFFFFSFRVEMAETLQVGRVLTADGETPFHLYVPSRMRIVIGDVGSYEI
jgi:hypothetical protein